MKMKEIVALGADIGGSHISTALVSLESGNIILPSYAEQIVDTKASADMILSRWGISIGQTLSCLNDNILAGIGFAMPGPFDYNTGIALFKNVDKYESLYKINVREKLRNLLSVSDSLPFRFLNDSISFGVGETWKGKASGYNNVVAVTLGTGFGSAFLTDGIPVTDSRRVPAMGYVYNVPYKDGIADEYFSTRWFVKTYNERTGKKLQGVKEIAEEASSNPEAKQLFEEFGRDIGYFLAPFLKRFDAQCLVIGGSISGAWPLFGNSLTTALEERLSDTRVLITELTKHAAIIGSARLFDDEFRRKMEHLSARYEC